MFYLLLLIYRFCRDNQTSDPVEIRVELCTRQCIRMHDRPNKFMKFIRRKSRNLFEGPYSALIETAFEQIFRTNR